MTTARFEEHLYPHGPGAPSAAAVYASPLAPPPPRTVWEILEATAERYPGAAAIDDGRTVLDYQTLLREVERLGGRLTAAGIGAGDRVGIRVPSGTAGLYLSILAALSVGAAYVPVDVDDPADRAELVWSGAGVCAILGPDGDIRSRRRPWRASITGPLRLGGARRPRPADDAWIIFTSGTTGAPKGVAVTHRSAAAFVDAEAGLFLRHDPLRPGDRVLAGLSVAFDASCEEMWLAWRHGACLVPAPRAVVKAGPELPGWLARRRVSVVSTVPTLASLWPAGSLDGVRLLILGGEACPSALADRLARAGGPEVWNTYGPTEATVVSCAARLSGGGEPVRIGLPLDGWRLAVVDPGSGRPVGWGEAGELVIGGVGLARYLDAEKDAQKFRPLDSLGWARAYRSGDLVRADPEGLVYLGRADEQVKIRGYRIEPGEIEAVLTQLPGIAQAAVVTCEPVPGALELAAYYRAGGYAAAPGRQAVVAYLRDRLPGHMVPAYLRELPAIPVLANGKADRRNLPPMTSSDRLLAGRGADRAEVAPATWCERTLAGPLAELLGLDRVPADADFFDQLGLSSLLVAHFCARARQQPQLPPVSVRDVYLHPTIQRLAAAISDRPADPGDVAAGVPDSARPEATAWRPGAARYAACGALQLLAFLALLLLGATVVSAGFRWISAASGAADLYLRSLGFSAGIFALLCALPIAAKWILVGRWKPRQINVWTVDYLRFWLVKTLVQGNPLAVFAGSPVYPWYLRALGARIGRRTLILSGTVPVCTDLLSIGDDAVIRAESSFTGYRAVAGVIRTGPVSIGRDALVGEHTVLDIGTRVGDGSQLGHTSALYESQAVPDGQRWHGSPAQPTGVDYRRAGAGPAAPLRRALYGTVQLLSLLLVITPLAVSLGVGALTRLRVVTGLESAGAGGLAKPGFYADGAALSAALFAGSLLLGAAVVLTVPRLLRRFVVSGRDYPLYGLRHAAHRVIRALSNTPFYLELLGDSSYVASYLQALGYRLPDFEQTGSNFGADLAHENPFLVEIGRGTMVSDGVSLVNADYSSTSFRLLPLSIGPRNFLGNAIAYPAGARTGENCMIATKAMVPLDGEPRANVGLLGSPCFEIPRSATTDPRFDHLKTRREFRRRLRAKNRHNLGTMALFLALRWVHGLIVTLLAMAAWELYRGNGTLVLTALIVAELLVSLGYFILVERALMRFGTLRPRYCSIYEPYFWWHERYWKLLAPLPGLLNGTPFKGAVWRLVGVRVGRRLFDDGCGIAERTLATIGDDCTLNAGSIIHGHSMEDGIFKSDHTVLEDGVTLGPGALVHYGVTIGRGAELRPDSFLMKGEKVPPRARWGGNPARPMQP
jgi:non-ribosomal peptide synthetase-like protein